MSDVPTLTPEDRARLDASLAVSVAECRAAGITDDVLLCRMATEIGTANLREGKQAGDAQAARILDHMVSVGILSWMEAEEAAGRPCFDTDDTVRRLTGRADRRPHIQA